MAYTQTVTANSTKIKAIDYNELNAALSILKSKVTFSTAYNPTLALTNSAKPVVENLNTIRSAINGFQTRFSSNCNCYLNMNCNQACQSVCASQSCQSTCAQTCQSVCASQACQSVCASQTCQSVCTGQACQSQCTSVNQSCQSTANQSCQSAANQSQCAYNNQTCQAYSNCNCDCDCGDD